MNQDIKDGVFLKGYLECEKSGVLGDFLTTVSNKTGYSVDYLNKRTKFLKELEAIE